jgi:hypothetical protein
VHRRAVFRLEARRIILAMRVCTAQLSHRFAGVEELGAIVGMSVASNARAMAPRIEPPVRATASISRVPGALPGLSVHGEGGPRNQTCGGQPSRHRWHPAVSASSLSLQQADHPRRRQGESSTGSCPTGLLAQAFSGNEARRVKMGEAKEVYRQSAMGYDFFRCGW